MPLIGNTARLIRQMENAQSKLKEVYWRTDNNTEKPRIVKHGSNLLNFGIKGLEPDPKASISSQSKRVQMSRRVSEPRRNTVWKNGKYYSKYELEPEI